MAGPDGDLRTPQRVRSEDPRATAGEPDGPGIEPCTEDGADTAAIERLDDNTAVAPTPTVLR